MKRNDNGIIEMETNRGVPWFILLKSTGMLDRCVYPFSITRYLW